MIGEPSQWDRVTLGYKGRMLISWKWRGDLGHSAGQGGDGAELAFEYWARVQAYAAQVNEGHTRIFDQLDVACQQIRPARRHLRLGLVGNRPPSAAAPDDRGSRRRAPIGH